MGTERDSSTSWGWLRVVLIGRKPRFTVVRIVVLVTVVFWLRAEVILPIRMQGVSMLPTYPTWGINFVNRLAYRNSPPQRGDVVAIRTSGESIMYLKRIIGLPGETVAFHEGRLLINGQAWPEPYIKNPCHWEMPEERVGLDEYFVVGDNRSMAIEDHYHGRMPRARLVGRIML